MVEIGDMKIEDYVDEIDDNGKQIVAVDAKRVLVGAGARILFYPTLLYNVFRNKIQAEFRWWDEIDQVVFIISLFTISCCYMY